MKKQLLIILLFTTIPSHGAKTFKTFKKPKINTALFSKTSLPSHAFDKNISYQKTFPTKKYSTATPIKSTENTGWWPWLKSKFFAEKEPQTYNLDLVKIKTPQNNNNSTRTSYWKQALATIAALLAGGTIAHMEEENPDDILNQEQFKDLREFIKLVEDPELKKRWQQCRSHQKCNDVIRNANLITIITSKPYIVLKDHQFDRVINAQLAQDVIEKNNLNLIGIPKKTILFDGNSWKVVTEKIDGVHPRELSLEQVQQLTMFIMKTGHWDLIPNNLLVDKINGKLFVIDTEDRSFNTGLPSLDNPLKIISYALNEVYPLSEPVKLWLQNQEELFETSKEKIKVSLLPQDFRGLDLKKIRKQTIEYETTVNKEYMFNQFDFRAFKIVNIED